MALPSGCVSLASIFNTGMVCGVLAIVPTASLPGCGPGAVTVTDCGQVTDAASTARVKQIKAFLQPAIKP